MAPSVPDRPILRDIPDVELMKVGSWPASTGQVQFTPEDLAAAVAAFQSPSIRKPVIKIGHTDPRFDGEPAVGFVDNLRLADNGSTLVGDLRGLPAWLADICASAFPDRSIEGCFGLTDQTGRPHKFALTGLALLGVSPPAVGTLTSLNDIARLYGVAATQTPMEVVKIMAADDTGADPAATPDGGGSSTGGSLSVEDVRRAFYETGPGADNDALWIEEMYLDPPTLVIQDDENGDLYTASFTVSGTSITWGDLTPVRREYVADTTASMKVAASYSSAAQSRGGITVAAAATTTEGEVMAEEQTFTADEVASLATALRLADTATAGDIVAAVQLLVDGVTAALELDETADIAAIVTAVEDAAKAAADAGTDEGGTDTAAKIAAAAKQRGMIVVDAKSYDEVRANAKLGAELAEKIEREDRERFVDAAILAGRIPGSRRDHWLTMLSADPSSREVLASIPENTIPQAARGYDGTNDTTDVRASAGYKALEG